MSKRIDADKLKAEIERLKELHKGLLSGKFRSGYNSAFQQVLSFIDSLQQEQQEGDFEKEIDKFLDETGAPYVWCNVQGR